MERRHAKGSVKRITVLPIVLAGFGATNANEMSAGVERHARTNAFVGFYPYYTALN
jgi:hypothetical protein